MTYPQNPDAGMPPRSVSNIPVPDPSVLTTAQLETAMKALRELLDAKFDAIQKDLDNFKLGHIESHNSTIVAAIQHRKELSDAGLAALQLQIAENDKRYQERYESQVMALNAAMDSRQKALEAALAAQVKAVEAALASKERDSAQMFEVVEAKFNAVNQQLANQQEKAALALVSSEKAVNKAAEANEKRFDGVNEFRKTLSDQTASFIPRIEADTRLNSLAEKIEDLKSQAQLAQGKAQAIPTSESRLEAMQTQLTDLNTKFATVSGRDSGTQLDRRFDELIKQVDALRLSQGTAVGKSSGISTTGGWIIAGAGLILTILTIVIVLANVFTGA